MGFLAAIPAAIGSAFSGIGGIGTLVSVAGSVMSGMAANAAAKRQAKIAEANAEIANQNAQRSQMQAQEEAQKNDNEVAAFIGQQEAAQSASGLSVGGRTQVLTRKAAARVGRIDTRNIIDQGAARSRNFLQQEADFKGQAQTVRAEGKNAMMQGILGGVSSLVGASSSIKSSGRGSAPSFRNDPWINRGGTNLRKLSVNTI